MRRSSKKAAAKVGSGPENQWRRFVLLTDDPKRIAELDHILDKYPLTRRELMILVTTLHARPEFREEDFGT